MDAEVRFDVLVLGGGSAGCVLAARLSEDPGRRVCLVEAGPDYGPYGSGRWPADILDASLDATESHDWGFEGGISSSRARIIGGCSSHNGCGMIWPTPADIDEWEASGAEGWSFAVLHPYLVRGEAMLRTRATRLDALEPARRAFVSAAAELGLPRLPAFNAPDALEGLGGVPVNAVGGVRWNAAFAYLDPARSRPNLTILADALVDCVRFEGSRATGATVLVRGTSRDLRADLVIVAAGAFGSPAILQRSRIDHPAVGASMANHPYAALLFRPADGADRSAVEVGHVLLKARVSGGANDGWDLLLGAWSGPGPDADGRPTGSRIAGIMATISKPRSRGSVRIRLRDPWVLPAVEHGFLTDADGVDRAVLAEGVLLARRLADTAAWRAVVDEELTPGVAVSGKDLEAWAAGAILGDYHPCGTCRMGRLDDPATVVGPNGGVHGTDGLFVVDASVFPTIPRANIHLTVIAVAERLAELIARA